ncbi:MAG: pyridoxamine 5'-phosphate oxidase [Xanthomonadaceae bacterium]|nr:pyridoxamine 5'-phosphate oxidase [Xanthomonadaceae bacterium]
MKLSDEIVARFAHGMDQAVASEVPEPTAMTLASADVEGRPSARTVLLKGFDADGFVFYTNLHSRKGRNLEVNPWVSLVFWWRELEQQVLIDGRSVPVSPEDADQYFASRPRGSRIGAWASRQSSPLDRRETLLNRVAEFETKYTDKPIPRPSHWSGFRVDPDRVEFWYGREFRLHERICYTAGDLQWTRELLYP